MSITLNRFIEKAGKDGIITLDSHQPDTLVTRGKTIFGKVAGWLRSKFKPGTVRAENRRVMEAFITAIKESPRYRGYIGNTAANRLSKLIDSGKPLTARMVNTIIKDLDKEKETINKNNQVLASRFSKSGIATDRYSFENILHEVAKEKNFNLSDNLNLDTLKRRVSKAILQKGSGGKHPISLKEARQAAKNAISKFIDTKQQLLSFIESSKDLSGTDKAFWKEFALETDLKNPEALKTIIKAQSHVKSFFNNVTKDGLSPSGFLKELDKFNTEMFKLMEDKDTGVDAMATFVHNSINSFIKKNNIPPDTLRNLYSLLNSDEIKQLRGALALAMVAIGIEDFAQVRHAGHLFNIFGTTIRVIGENAGMTENTITNDLSSYSNYPSERDIPPNTIRTLQEIDINFPPPEIAMGDKGEGVFSPSFIKALEKDLSNFVKEYMTQDSKFKNGGINEVLIRNIGGSLDATINGNKIADAGSSVREKTAEFYLKDLCRNPKNYETDERILRAVTTLSQQGFWESSLRMLAAGEPGPFRGVFLGGDPEEHPNKEILDISREGGDIVIKRSIRMPVSRLVFSNGESEPSDPTRSFVSQSFTLRVSIDSILKGDPKVKVVDSGYKFEFQPQTTAQRLLEDMRPWTTSKSTTEINSLRGFARVYGEELNQVLGKVSKSIASKSRPEDEIIKEAVGEFLRGNNANILGMTKFNFSKFGKYADNLAAKVGEMILDGKNIGEIYSSIMNELDKTESIPMDFCKELSSIYNYTKETVINKLKELLPKRDDRWFEQAGESFARKGVVNAFVLRFIAARIANLTNIREIASNAEYKSMAVNLSAMLQAQANGTRFRSENKQMFNPILDNFEYIFNNVIDNIVARGGQSI
ncbi:MAG: hypothetical protein JRI31_01740 [Deltaproteobacteria bacterium]|nr:hypothetical protein [Deltaproteobacteria bacterium]